MLMLAECRCHVWVLSKPTVHGSCRMCGDVPYVTGPVYDEDDKTVCLHSGPCRKDAL